MVRFAKLLLALCIFLGGLNVFAKQIQIVPDADYVPGIEQQIQSGKLKGFVANQGQTLGWRAIPYAEAPLGALRWHAPQAAKTWQGTFNAQGQSRQCPQVKGGKYLGQEDCLTLDIYRPNSTAKKLPVIFYIHGGNNQLGDSDEINPEQWVVNADAILVSVNYRLGTLGFNNLPALRGDRPFEASGSFGLLDIHFALQWVKQNIAQFGGNPNNITIAGFSAGGRDVMAMLISPLFRNQFQQAISFSGGMTLADYDASPKIIARALAPLLVADGVKPDIQTAEAWLLSDKPAVRSYLSQLAAQRLAQLMINAGIRMAAFPHLYNDGELIPKEGFHTRAYTKVPVILFTGAQEFSLFAQWDPYFASRPKTALIDNSPTAKEFAFVKKYGSEFYALFNTQVPAQTMLPEYSAPIYSAELTWGQDKALVGDAAQRLGPFHGIWIPFLTNEVKDAATEFSQPLQSPGASV